ncbi:hypothetical protein PVAND_011860 [Polypedilum vanderplanki]|uniref:Actin interacting protein 3-like C-terminal domain-containing protein n=1 Tax=Polypedilum vanderplanki TaxID=319348 RepID=A0A9J6CKX6_POLVA|nr:hypothetical protein PVAND_011860 [Polypedilum vanderplanki]
MSIAVAELEIRHSDKSNNSGNSTAPLAKREEEDDDEDEDINGSDNKNVNNNDDDESKTLSSESLNNKNEIIINDSNNNKNIDSTSDQPQIIQTDEIITVVVNENSSKVFREILMHRNDDEEIKNNDNANSESVKVIDDTNDRNNLKSILCANTSDNNNERKSLLRKKSVSFEKNEEIKKFIVGEEIIDKQNPFRSTIEIDDKYRLVKNSKKSSIPTKNGSAPLASEENDFITKEEILKQSKYVPVYVKNPDKVLTYDKAVLERLKIKDNDNKQPQQKIPVPLPRKSNNKIPVVVKKNDKKEKKRNKALKNSKYPDLSDIKVKTGTDIDESLYDPNEVVLNAKKFDSRFKKLTFGSTDDLEEIVDKEDDTSEEKKDYKEGEEQGEKKSYTNTVNSEEFRQYLKNKGLVLFPIKTNSNGVQSTSIKNKQQPQTNGSAFVEKQKPSAIATLKRIDKIDSIKNIDTMEGDRNNKKKSVFHRLSSIFTSSKGKTTPKTNEPLSRSSYSSNLNHNNKNNYETTSNGLNGGNNNLGSNIKRVILERSNFHNSDNRSVSANSEFMQLDMQIKQQQHRHIESDDTKSSISSVLTAAADDDLLDTPVVMRRKPSTNIPNGYVSANATASLLYRNIDLNKSKLYQSKVKQNNGTNRIEISAREQPQPQQALHSSTLNNGARENDDIIKPKVQRPSNISRSQPVNKSLIKPPVPLRRSTERQSMPIMKSGERYKPIATERNKLLSNGSASYDDSVNYRMPNTSLNENSLKNHASSTPSDEKKNTIMVSPKMSPIINNLGTQQKPSEIDPITFAKIHEIKKKTDEVLMNKTTQLYTRPVDMQKLQNNHNQRLISQQQQQQNFVRNSPQRATITDVYQNKMTSSKRDDCGNNNFAAINRQSFSINSQHQQPQRSQSVLDNMTMNKNSLYGEVTYRRPDGSNVNVLMRRPESTTMDRNQIMQKIYEYYRKSVNNTPISMTQDNQKNLHYKTQSTDTSPVSYASLNTMRSTLPKAPMQQHVGYAHQPRSSAHYSDYSFDKKGGYFYTRPSTGSNTNSMKSTRNQTISESDSVFLPSNNGENEGVQPHYVVVNSEKLRPVDVLKMQQQKRAAMLYSEPERIYDVVYSSTASSRKNSASENGSGSNYGNINRSQAKVMQRSASAMSSPMVFQNRQAINGRMTPLILHPQFAPRQGDIIINNQIYRPISEIPTTNSLSNKNTTVSSQPIYSTPMRKRQTSSHNNYESDSEAGEIQSIMQRKYEEDYQNDKSSRNQQNEQVDDRRRSSSRRGGGADDPRRHTLGAEMMHYANQGNMQRSLDLEMGQPQKSRKGIPIRAYTPQHQGPLFDDDPGIMSEVETASTGFRRGGKSRSSLPVVRTPSKTLERPLGLVFLQYRSETKRALLPNEITSIDTVRALFVRSFPRQLSMAYLEGPNVKIYIHDSSKDMFYELEDVRSHLREIRDRSVLRLFESNEVAAPQVLPGGPGVPQPLPQQGGSWDHDQSYFSEPEFDSEYQHQHIHKSKVSKRILNIKIEQLLL